jgi:uncharacterized protein YciI
VKYVLFYDSADDAAAAARLHFDQHRGLWAEYQERGSLLLIGPFTDGRGAMAVFRTREAAEQFAREDPFVAHGVVRGWQIREWNEALVAES